MDPPPRRSGSSPCRFLARPVAPGTMVGSSGVKGKPGDAQAKECRGRRAVSGGGVRGS